MPKKLPAKKFATLPERVTRSTTKRGSTEVAPPTKASPKKPKQVASASAGDVVVAAGNAKVSGSLAHLLRVYKGMDDWHLPVFRETRKYTGASKVLYPGSDKHATASLIFPEVYYVDLNEKLKPIFEDPGVLKWIADNKEYEEESCVVFDTKNFETSQLCQEGSMDLLITACAGFVSKWCTKYVKPGGFVLASDAHYDARLLFVTKGFELVGVFDDGGLNTTEAGKNGHFITTTGEPITHEQVVESSEKPKNRRSFKLMKEAIFYLFRKTGD